jgi:hypothetical protein
VSALSFGLEKSVLDDGLSGDTGVIETWIEEYGLALHAVPAWFGHNVEKDDEPSDYTHMTVEPIISPTIGSRYPAT